jgi:tetratricopeptide (TPR) repeat protein
MIFSKQKFICGILSAGLAGTVLLGLSGCGTDMLTWAKDAKAQGMQQYNDGRYAEAAGAFRNAIRQDPKDPETEYWLALSYEQTGSYPEAIDAFKTCLSLLPTDTSSVRYSAVMHDTSFDRLAHIVAKYDRTGSETDLIVKTASEQKSSEDYRLLGRILRYRGDADTALDNYRQAVATEPTNFVAQRELGLYLGILGQNQEAGQVLRDAYRLNQDDKDINAALRRIGTEPGPALLVQSAPVVRQPAASPTPAGPTDPGLSSLTMPAGSTVGPSMDNQAPRD